MMETPPLTLLNRLYQKPDFGISDGSIGSPGEIPGWLDWKLPYIADTLVEKLVFHMQTHSISRAVGVAMLGGWIGDKEQLIFATFGLVMYESGIADNYFLIINTKAIEYEPQSVEMVKLLISRAMKNLMIETFKLNIPVDKLEVVFTPIQNSNLPLDTNVVA